MVIVERVRWKIVLCSTMYNCRAQCDMHTHVSNYYRFRFVCDFTLCILEATEFGEIMQNKAIAAFNLIQGHRF